jgi:hypothetical protein
LSADDPGVRRRARFRAAATQPARARVSGENEPIPLSRANSYR